MSTHDLDNEEVSEVIHETNLMFFGVDEFCEINKSMGRSSSQCTHVTTNARFKKRMLETNMHPSTSSSQSEPVSKKRMAHFQPILLAHMLVHSRL